MQNNGDLTWGHHTNKVVNNLILRLKTVVGGEICQRCALPAELQPHLPITLISIYYKGIIKLIQRNILQVCDKCCLNVDKGTNGSVLHQGAKEIINKKYNTLAIQ